MSDEITRIPEPALDREQLYDLYRCANAMGAHEAYIPQSEAVAELLYTFSVRCFYELLGEAPAALGEYPAWLRELAEESFSAAPSAVYPPADLRFLDTTDWDG